MATYNGIKKIKIGDNIFNLYDSGNSGGTITQVKTTAGAHTAITVTSGAANFNVPTKTSHLTNDSGFITSHNTYTISSSGSGNAVTSISLSGTTFTVTKGSTFLTSHQDISGKFDKSGGTITGATTIKHLLTLYREGTTSNNYPAGITFTNKDTTTGKSNDARIYVYNDHSNPSGTDYNYGNNMVISPRGALIIGGGEAAENHYTALGNSFSSENIYITADSDIYIQTNANTIANRTGVRMFVNDSNDFFIMPSVADTATTGVGYIGANNYRWKGVYTNYLNTSGNITCGGELGVASNLGVAGDLVVSGIGSIGGNTTIVGSLTINNHSTAIGTIKDAYLTANKTVANNTGTSLCSFSLEAGVWLIHAWLRFPSNATGSRVGNIGSSGAADWQASMTAVNGNVSQLHFTRILNPTSTTTYHLNVIQTSGANMTLLAGAAGGFNAMRAVRIQ